MYGLIGHLALDRFAKARPMMSTGWRKRDDEGALARSVRRSHRATPEERSNEHQRPVGDDERRVHVAANRDSADDQCEPDRHA